MGYEVSVTIIRHVKPHSRMCELMSQLALSLGNQNPNFSPWMRGKKPKFWGAIARTWAQIPGLGFGPVRVHWMVRGGTSSYPIWNLIIKEQMEGVSKRNYSSDIIHAAQVFIPATRVILQEAPLMETCTWTYEKEGNPKISMEMLLPPH